MKREKRNIPKWILFILMSLSVVAGKAQSNMAFYPMEEQFNSSGYNPAFLYSKEKFTFSIFPLGGTNIGYNNQEVIKKLVTESLLGVTTDADYKNILNNLAGRASFNQNIESTLLSFTFRSRKGFFNFRINENQNFSASLNGELTRFIFKNDIESATIDRIQELPAQGIHYREYSLGYSLPARNHKFIAGIRAKIYFGKAAFFSGLSGSIQKKSDNYILNAGGKVKLSIPLVQTTENGKTNDALNLSGPNLMSYLTNPGNQGFGLDLGFNFKLSPELSFSMSVLDLGWIDWKSNVNSKIFTGIYPISSANVTSNVSVYGVETITKNFQNKSFADTISNRLKQSIDHSEFSSTLPVKVYAGMKYDLNPKLKINLVDRYVYLKNMQYNSLSALVSLDVRKAFSVSTGYSMIGNSYLNIPVAMLFREDFGQIYLGTDNLLSFVIPSISDFAGFTFGACFYLFKNQGRAHSTSEHFPFYGLKKARRNQKNGLIRKEYKEF